MATKLTTAEFNTLKFVAEFYGYPSSMTVKEHFNTNLEQTRMVLCELSSRKLIHRSNKGYYRVTDEGDSVLAE